MLSAFDGSTERAAATADASVGESIPSVDTGASAQPAASNLWDEFKLHATAHLDTLALAATSLIEGQAPPEVVSEAFLGARSLEQTLTARGLFEGARMARELSQAFSAETILFPPQLLHMCELVVELESVIDQSARPLPASTGETSEGPVVLIVSRDQGLAGRIAEAQPGKEFHSIAAEFPASVGDLLTGGTPTAAVVDLHAGGSVERGLLLLDEFSNHVPPIPVLVLLHRDALAHRIEVARRGARTMLPIDVSAEVLANAVADMLAQVRASAPKVLAVDDDPTMLGIVASLLDARGLHVTTLGDSGRFWEIFNQGVPDLVVLGAEMKPVSGLELCRGVRDDPFWRLIPVVMLTAQNDAPSIERVFAAGADDFVAKPVVGPELVTRIANRLERFYLQRQQTGTDALTGVATRASADPHLRRLLRMAARSHLPLALAVLDIDGLRQINERHGIQAGDGVLRRLGQLLTKTLRAEDVVVRLGGDEFVVAMYNACKQDAAARIQSVLDSFAQETFSESSHGSFTASFCAGVVQYLLDGSEVPWLFEAAGQLLTQGKQAGGRCVQTSGHGAEGEAEELTYDVVIVEEDEAVASLLHHGLLTQGIRALWIRDGETAVDKLAGAAPIVRTKVVVLEMDVPGLDGLAVLRRLADDQVLSRTRVIMLTNRSNEEDVVAAFETGAFDYVTKPFSMRVLTQRIRRALPG